MGTFLNQPSFSAGEVAPELYGRVDLALYQIGLRTCRNFMVRQYGGVANRPGTTFIAEVKDHSKKVRLIPFQFNEEQTYAIEMGDEYMRIIKDGGEVLQTAKNIVAITLSTDITVEITSHGWSNGDQVYFQDVGGTVELNGRSFTVSDAASNTFKLKDYHGNYIDGSDYTAFTSGGTAARIYTVATPWDEADLFNLNYAQSNDVLTVVHNDYYPQDITRTGHAAWTVNDFANREGPFLDINTTATTVYASAETGSGITITASTGIFDASMVGELLYIEQEPSEDATKRWEVGKTISSSEYRRAGSHYYLSVNSGKTTGTVRPDHTDGISNDGDDGVEWQYLHSGFGIVQITGYTNSTTVTATVIKRLPLYTVSSSFPTDIWAKAAWSEAQGYPAAVAYHKQRMWFGCTRQQPNGLWLSGVGARTFFGKGNPILDDEAITIKLDTIQVNAIRHLLPLKQLITLTSSSEHLINGPDGLILATDPPFADVQGYTGSSRVVPVIIGNTALFVQDMGSVVRSLSYSLESDAFTGIELSARSPHLFQGRTVVDWAYQRHPLSIIWCVMDDGALIGLTYMEEQEVFAWHRHDTDGFFESVCTIREGNESAVYFVVRRTINGQTKRYIERLNSRYFDTIRDAHFVDCGLTYDGRNTGATTITITGGSTWDSPETLTLTASASLFKSTDVGDQIVFRYENENGTEIALRLEITDYTSATEVDAIPSKEVPATHRSAARTDWEFARNTFFPLHHLEGKDVSVLADGNVVEGISVSDGQVTLPIHASVVHIGLPYVSQIETLDMAGPQGELKAKSINVPRVFLTVQESRALFIGINGFDNLQEIKQRAPALGYDAAIPAETTVFEQQTNSVWSNRGRICMQQTYPLPVTINSITPEVTLGYG